MTRIELINEETIGVHFQFDQSLVNQIRALNSRRWNPKDKRWEIHIVHLADVMRIFCIHPSEIPSNVVEIYQEKWIRSTLRVKISNVTTQLCGARFPLAAIDEATSFPLSGHQYSPRFIKGSWDGKKHLFDRRKLTFPTGLWPQVQETLKQEGTEYTLSEKRTASRPTLSLTPENLSLRPYQQEAVEAALEAKRGILQLATGAGKTVIAAALLSRLEREGLFFVHTRDLLYQAKHYFEKTLNTKIGQVGDGVTDLRPITVATIQSTVRALGGAYGQSLDEDVDEEDPTDVSSVSGDIVDRVETSPIIFFDECHHLPAETCYGVAMRTFGADHRFGLSATPYRTDRHDLLIEAAVGAKIFRANSSDLIDEGFLVAPEIHFFAVPAYHSHQRGQDYANVYAKYVVDNDVRHRLIVDRVSELTDAGLTVLILVSQIRHGENLAALIPHSQFIQGGDPTSRRQAALKALEEKSLPVLIATTLADEGLDVPTLGAVVMAGGGKSETKALQRIGRALRPAPGKERAVIIDFLDQAPYLKEHSIRRLEIYQTEPRFNVRTEGFSL